MFLPVTASFYCSVPLRMKRTSKYFMGWNWIYISPAPCFSRSRYSPHSHVFVVLCNDDFWITPNPEPEKSLLPLMQTLNISVTLLPSREYIPAISCTGEIDISANIETTRDDTITWHNTGVRQNFIYQLTFWDKLEIKLPQVIPKCKSVDIKKAWSMPHYEPRAKI